MHLEPKGRNWGIVVNWDDLGKLYASIICAWTVVLVVGVTWLIRNRQLPFIKIRNLPLAITSTAFLHVYLVKIFLAYTTNGHFLCSAEYWIMSIYLPFGIALYQAYLSQLGSIWQQQQRLVQQNSGSRHDEAGESTNLYQRWQRLSRLHKTYCLIAFGVFTQLVLTTILYAESPVLQGDWSSFGNVTHAKGQGLCRKSPSWIPSAFWQLFWSWFYGPYTLLKIRHIRDIHFWRAQVLISVIAGLPGSPMWLAALYLPQFKPVNMRFVPPMWLAPGIIIMQFAAIFIPMFECWSSGCVRHGEATLFHAQQGLEQYSRTDSSFESKLSPNLSVEYMANSPQSASPNSDTRINAMPSLRAAMTVNPRPLLEFAATKEFSAENILFLIRVRHLRSSWSTSPKSGEHVQSSSLAHLFTTALDIYIQLVSDRTAEFPINIESKIKKQLDAMFDSSVSQHDNSFTPANIFEQAIPKQAQSNLSRIAPVRIDSSDSDTTLWEKAVMYTEPVLEPYALLDSSTEQKVAVPAAFGEHIFDDAERSIEYLVWTNTWQNFIKSESLR